MEGCKPVPQLMVLYESSGTQIQFSDGSCLRLASCGTVFSHQAPAHSQKHPLQEKTCILQRTQYVTSAYKNKVSQAVGFRNLFAERPFLCKNLFEEVNEEIKLYSVIKNIKWAKSLETARPKLEYFEDGSIRFTSEDDYASLQLSPHHRDFSVCYLSLVKPLSKTDSGRMRKPRDHIGCPKPRPDSPTSSELADSTATSLATTLSQYRTSTPINLSSQDVNSENLNSSQYRPHKPKVVRNHLSNVDTNAGSFLELIGSSEDKAVTVKPTEDEDTCVDEGKLLEEKQQTQEKCAPPVMSCDLDEKNRRRYTWITQHISANDCPQVWYHPFQISLQAAHEYCQEKTSSKDTKTCLKKDAKKLQKVDKDQFVISPLPEPVPLKCPGQHLHKWLNFVDSKHQQLWPVLVGNSVQLETDLCQGRLKVLVLSGVVYRFIYLSNLIILEIYPGDGSVIISQGFSGHYFSHISFVGGQVVERVHSVKAPPLLSSKYPYSVARLIDYGCRLLRTASQIKYSQTLPVCWKYEVNRILEPLPLILLEESIVPSLGRFQAYSNGWIHVVFEDRTTLDMNWDLTDHLRWWLKRQPYEIDMAEERMKLTMAKCESNICRLLLPSGHDRLVDIKHPNIYSQYVQPSVEWARWVNCLPTERLKFQKAMTEEEKEMKLVHKELQKINCFDYIVRNTLEKQIPATKVPSNSHVSEDSAFFSDRSVSKSSDISSSTVRQIYQPLLQEDIATKIEELLSTQVMDQNRVKAALLLTSRAIHDIDYILEAK